MNNDMFKDQDHREDKLNDEQIDQVSGGGGDPHGKKTDPHFDERPRTGFLAGVGDMKKDPA